MGVSAAAHPVVAYDLLTTTNQPCIRDGSVALHWKSLAAASRLLLDGAARGR